MFVTKRYHERQMALYEGTIRSLQRENDRLYRLAGSGQGQEKQLRLEIAALGVQLAEQRGLIAYWRNKHDEVVRQAAPQSYLSQLSYQPCVGVSEEPIIIYTSYDGPKDHDA